jgi:hypothetical protein
MLPDITNTPTKKSLMEVNPQQPPSSSRCNTIDHAPQSESSEINFLARSASKVKSIREVSPIEEKT